MLCFLLSLLHLLSVIWWNICILCWGCFFNSDYFTQLNLLRVVYLMSRLICYHIQECKLMVSLSYTCCIKKGLNIITPNDVNPLFIFFSHLVFLVFVNINCTFLHVAHIYRYWVVSSIINCNCIFINISIMRYKQFVCFFSYVIFKLHTTFSNWIQY